VPLDEITQEERLKRDENPLDIWDKIVAHAGAGQAPLRRRLPFQIPRPVLRGATQDSFMLRVRVRANALASAQMPRGWPALLPIGRRLRRHHDPGQHPASEIAPKSCVGGSDAACREAD